MTADDRNDDLWSLRESPGSADAQHDEAIVRAEISLLVRALGPYGVLSRDALRREVGADYWHEPFFDRALEAAVREGQVEALPFGFFALRRKGRRV